MSLIPSLYFLEKNFLANKYKKQMWYKKKKFSDIMKNVQIFSSEIGRFQYDHRFLFSREIGDIRSCKKTAKTY